MSNHIKIKKGLDIKLQGAADKVMGTASAKTYSLKPTDFHGVTPKLVVRVGDEVKAGSPIFFDKYNPVVQYTSPVSGEVVEINRGAKRKLLEIKILADSNMTYESYSPKMGSRSELIESLTASGLWACIKMRPYDLIANPDDSPKAIVVSAFDSAPLGADMDYILHGREEDFQAGLDALTKLTEGPVHLNTHSELTTSNVFQSAKNVTKNTFSGPHPSGLVGVQINKLSPINKGERVWSVDAQHVAMIGSFMKTGKVDMTKVIAVAGSMVERPRYYRIITGAQLSEVMKDAGLSSEPSRVISGNVLTGEAIGSEGCLGFYHNQVTAIPEGGHSEFMGWVAPNVDKYSFFRNYFSWLMPSKQYDLNTNENGEWRPFVVTGEYEKVMPMDIMPLQLLKAMTVGDIELMENLGIYEVAPEDFALCEFICPSKSKMQQLVRETLDMAHEELG